MLSLLELKSRVELYYDGTVDNPRSLDSTVIMHANDYFLMASEIYGSLGDRDFDYSPIYPLLTLLGFSAELFLKGFHICIVDDSYTPIPIVDDCPSSCSRDAYSSLGKSEGFLTSKGTIETLNRPKGNRGHHLRSLLDYHLAYNKDLHSYLVLSYFKDTERDLEEDMEYYAMVFEDVRYIFERDGSVGPHYQKDLTIVFRLVQSLYNSINGLYKD